MMIKPWAAEALNTAPNSANEIHGDSMAKAFGFEGGLVPGVTVSAYLIHPAIEHWGMDWLDSGAARCRIVSPLYDGEQFTVDVDGVTDNQFASTLTRPNGTVSAHGEVSLPEIAPSAPSRRGDPLVEHDYVAPPATFEVWHQLQENGCHAFRYTWDDQSDLYLRDVAQMPSLLQPKQQGFANMSFMLGCSNWILAGNAYMNPWVHLETRSQNFQRVPKNTSIIAEMAVKDSFEKKGHQFIDVDVDLYDEKDNSCLMTTMLRAIFKLRGAD
jgi:hypothetical protein